MFSQALSQPLSYFYYRHAPKEANYSKFASIRGRLHCLIDAIEVLLFPAFICGYLLAKICIFAKNSFMNRKWEASASEIIGNFLLFIAAPIATVSVLIRGIAGFIFHPGILLKEPVTESVTIVPQQPLSLENFVPYSGKSFKLG